jgi:hypothetical protein
VRIVHDHALHLIYHQDYKGACGAFLDALKLDPGNAEIEDGLRYSSTPE